MKKISIILLTTLSLGIVSCNMDKYPYDSVPTEEALLSISDFEQARTGFYSSYIGLAGGSFILTPELQADAFNAVADFSNTQGDIHRWIFESTNATISAIWTNYYAQIGRTNFFIDGVENMDSNPELSLTDIQKQQLNVYEGEAYFSRAYAYFCLANLFCKTYNPTTAESDLGLPLQLKYEPKIPASQYPDRSSLYATYEQILSDLKDAEVRIATAKNGITDPDRNYTTINTAAKNCGNYITVDVVTALKARVALQMKNYKEAADYASSLIASGLYPLSSTPDDFKEIWKNDKGTETIWQIAMNNADDAGTPMGTLFIGYPTSSKDYIPTQTLIDLYTDNDIRKATYFGDYHLSVSTGTSDDILFFNKYPGNDNFNAIGGDIRYLNQPKAFRIAEMYLIAAEAYAQQGTVSGLEKGSKYLNDLKQNRITDFDGGTYTNREALMNEVMDERERELVCEGFRLMDLKRWGKGVKRGAAQNPGLILFPGQSSTDKLDKAADDPRMVWPIPKNEMDANPKLAGQQNPGY
ncbi:RagB/SusD family nutrient uptake outer membrane protein [Bacteroides sp.]